MARIPVKPDSPSAPAATPMRKNARLTPLRRQEKAQGTLSAQLSHPQAARDFLVPAKTLEQWLGHGREPSFAGTAKRSSRPQRLRQPRPRGVAERIATRWRQRLASRRIAVATGVSMAASHMRRRAGLSRLRDWDAQQARALALGAGAPAKS